MENKSFYQKLEETGKQIQNSDIPEEQKLQMLQNLQNLRDQRVNILITGATGCGKSSTINALFGTEVAQ